MVLVRRINFQILEVKGLKAIITLLCLTPGKENPSLLPLPQQGHSEPIMFLDWSLDGCFLQSFSADYEHIVCK